ncbi:MAG: hypothetical protein ACREIU_02830, partial [Planctomycetota bacterium]
MGATGASLLLPLLAAGDFLRVEGPDPGDRYRTWSPLLERALASGPEGEVDRLLASFPEGATPFADAGVIAFLRSGEGVPLERARAVTQW